MSRSRSYSTAFKQNDQVKFIELLTALSHHPQFLSTLRSSYYSYPHYLNEIIIFQATIIGFTNPKFISHLKPLEYIISRTGNIDRSLLSTSALQLVELFQTATFRFRTPPPFTCRSYSRITQYRGTSY